VIKSKPGSLNQLLRKVLASPKAPIYHYTSVHGLLDILKSRELWATDATSLNDLTEVVQGWDYITKWLQKQSYKNEILDKLTAIARDQNFTSKSNICVLSASTLKDDANQWRLYAKGGSGYVIEIDPKVDLAIVTSECGFQDQEDISEPARGGLTAASSDWFDLAPWYYVLYRDKDKDAALQQFVSNAQRLVAPSFRNAEERSLYWDRFEGYLRVGLDSIARMIKIEGFAGEKEVRATAVFWGKEIGPHQMFRSTPFGIAAYARLAAPSSPGYWDRELIRVGQGDENRHKVPIKSIGIGPLLKDRDQKQILETLCTRYGIDEVEIWNSEVPLR